MDLVFCLSGLAAWGEGDQSPWNRGLGAGGLNDFSGNLTISWGIVPPGLGWNGIEPPGLTLWV